MMGSNYFGFYIEYMYLGYCGIGLAQNHHVIKYKVIKNVTNLRKGRLPLRALANKVK